MLKQFAHFDAALAVFFEFKGRLKGRAGAALGGQVVHWQRLAVQPRELGLRIEGVHVRRPPVGKNVNDTLGLRRKVRRSGSER